MRRRRIKRRHRFTENAARAEAVKTYGLALLSLLFLVGAVWGGVLTAIDTPADDEGQLITDAQFAMVCASALAFTVWRLRQHLSAPRGAAVLLRYAPSAPRITPRAYELHRHGAFLRRHA